MSFIVTARKWRPTKFSEVVGQEHITTTLINSIRNNRIAHAFIFAGPRGVGKTTTARILAKALNCLNPKDSEPCNECELCLSFNSSQSLDIIEIDGASNRRIEEIRTLRESVKYAPTKGLYKVYIIDEVHMLTNESFNALLKTLEEPPERTIFIFATTDVHKVPLTIISRCQRFDFRRIEMNEIKNLLKKIADEEKIEIDDQSLTIIAKKADGALRDAESIFDQLISFSGNKIEASVVAGMLNLIDEEVYFRISDAIVNKNYKAAFEVSKLIYDNGWSFIDFLNGLLEHFRNLLTVAISGNSDQIESADIYKKKYLDSRNTFTESDLLRMLNYLGRVFQEFRFSHNHKLKIEITLCHLIGLERTQSITSILDQLEEIKKKTQSGTQVTENKIFSSGGHISDIPVVINTGFKINQASEPSSSYLPGENDLTKKWEMLLEEINKEKIFLGSTLTNIRVKESDKHLLLQNIDPASRVIIDRHGKYLNSKMEQVFGKGFTVSHQDYSYNSDEKVSSGPDETDLVKAILNELGGEEI